MYHVTRDSLDTMLIRKMGHNAGVIQRLPLSLLLCVLCVHVHIYVSEGQWTVPGICLPSLVATLVFCRVFP